jgi:MFS family permease
MTSLLGTAIAATFVGSLSDRIGRRPVMLVCVGFGVIGSIAKYLARSSFWGFCAANFITGLFGATLIVSMAYASDVAHTRAEKDGVIGSLVGIYMVGGTAGGLIAIAMGNVSLFSPLLVGAALNFFATVFSYYYLIEPNKLLLMGTFQMDEEEEEEEGDGPETLDIKLNINILGGAFLDNAGSTGLVPFCLSPLAFNAYLADFVAEGQEPLMTETAFKWISTI